jgi:hypothetical protein
MHHRFPSQKTRWNMTQQRKGNKEKRKKRKKEKKKKKRKRAQERETCTRSNYWRKSKI